MSRAPALQWAWHRDARPHLVDVRIGTQGLSLLHLHMAQLYGCTAANGVWVVPISHKLGKIISPRWPPCRAAERCAGRADDPQAGDSVITNRILCHGAFGQHAARNWRVTVTFGFPSAEVGAGREGRRACTNRNSVYDASAFRERGTKFDRLRLDAAGNGSRETP